MAARSSSSCFSNSFASAVTAGHRGDVVVAGELRPNLVVRQRPRDAEHLPDRPIPVVLVHRAEGRVKFRIDSSDEGEPNLRVERPGAATGEHVLGCVAREMNLNPRGRPG
jgi:hypothetical protein